MVYVKSDDQYSYGWRGSETGMRQPAPLPTFGSPEELGDDVRVQLLLGHRYLLPPHPLSRLGDGRCRPKDAMDWPVRMASMNHLVPVPLRTPGRVPPPSLSYALA